GELIRFRNNIGKAKNLFSPILLSAVIDLPTPPNLVVDVKYGLTSGGGVLFEPHEEIQVCSPFPPSSFVKPATTHPLTDA
ncbi:MAG: hypothetical protein Q9217_006021, partial [Psora testacea]